MNKYPLYISIDTCIFESNGYNFDETSALGLLKKYIADGKVKVFLSDIVYSEMKAHISEKCSQIISDHENWKRKSAKELSSIFLEQAFPSLFMEYDEEELKGKCLEILDNYVHSIAEEILDISSVNIGALFNDYFEMKPPFEDKKKKKSEFPDACIIQEIKNRFDKSGEMVFIISSDNGFNKSFEGIENYRIIGSLNDLYDIINKNDEEKEEAYNRTRLIFDSLKERIEEEVKRYICDNEYIEVFGQTIDRHGIIDGYDYTEISLHNIDNLSVMIHSVDDISDNESTITVRCEANMIVDCSYDDYDNAPWDSEEKEYLFVETVTIREVHNARFACSIVIDREDESFVLRPFKVLLGGDTRVSREKKSE